MRRSDMENLPHSRAIGSLATKEPRNERTLLAEPQPVAGSLTARHLARETFGDPATFVAPPGSVSTSSLLQLQRQQGNRFVQRVVAAATRVEGEGNLIPDVERAIESSRGGGQSLDSGVKASMGQALNADFSGVRVHTDAGADGLNQSLSARAFTTGHDIYFRQGEYNPGSSGGRELLAHELTHVLQQNPDRVQTKSDDDGIHPSCACGGAAAGPQMKLSISQPSDLYEQEADRVAHAVMHQEQQSNGGSSHAQAISRQMPEEDKDKLQGKYRDDEIRRQMEEDKDQLQGKYLPEQVRRQVKEEDEKKVLGT
jgi:hypothetical protein